MFNPLTKESYTETVESWAASFFALLSLLPRHPDIQKELALPTLPADGGQVGTAAVGSGGSTGGGTGGALGRHGGDAAGQLPQQQQQPASGAAVREPAGVQVPGGGAAGSGTADATGSGAAGDGSDGSSADKALEIASALREHIQQQDGGEAQQQQQQQQQGGSAAVGGLGGPEPLAGGRQQSGVSAALYWLTLAAIGALGQQ